MLERAQPIDVCKTRLWQTKTKSSEKRWSFIFRISEEFVLVNYIRKKWRLSFEPTVHSEFANFWLSSFCNKRWPIAMLYDRCYSLLPFYYFFLGQFYLFTITLIFDHSLRYTTVSSKNIQPKHVLRKFIIRCTISYIINIYILIIWIPCFDCVLDRQL